MIVKRRKEWLYINQYTKETTKKKLWVRPEKMFLSEIPERPDNITGQKYRFVLCEELEKNFLK